MPGFQVGDVQLSRNASSVVRTVVRGPRVRSAGEVAAAQSDLPSPPDGSVLELRMQFIDVVIMTPQGPVVSR